MRKINCIAIDSWEPDLKILSQHINGIPFLELCAVHEGMGSAASSMHMQKADLLFLDIENCGAKGLAFLKSLSSGTKIIITTNKDHFALEAFNMNVLDYLLKPLTTARFLQAADKARDFFSLLDHRNTMVCHSEAYGIKQEYLFVISEYALVKIKLSEISYIEGSRDYLKIHVTDRLKPILTRMTMKALEQKLPQDLFFRVHKSYIVAFDKIELIRSQRIKIGQNTVPISDRYYETFCQKVNI